MNQASRSAKVVVIIPNWNTRRWLPGCLEGLRNQTFTDFQTILVDNGSNDDSLDFVRKNYPEVEIVAFAENRGFAVAVNAGIKASCSEYVALLNVDTVPQPNWLSELVRVMEGCPNDVGCLAAKMLSMSNPAIVDDAGNTFSWYGSAHKRGHGEPAENYTEIEEVFSVSGGASLYRRSFFKDVGYFDETFESYLEDVDLGIRGQLRGYRCLFVPTAEVWHQWSGAKIPRPKYVYLSTKNRLSILLKNIPWRLLLWHLHTLLYGQFYFFLVYKKPIYSMIGMGLFIVSLPQILNQRRSIQKHRKISIRTLEALLSKELGEPSLWEIIKSKISPHNTFN